ncbi:MAG: hypothetical protein HOH20_01555 [Rhodospirillaceae bacterium]|jgi:hypothetical protein|nr:hypothetical protein [Rhodospirillaceae bacterium]MBT5240374.1 hypothetical protein [Rhodospirillaceae bacterium]MBT5567013.1 hypothetical protein [Rhodospirillaceae bacterium]MBT6088240.1 hypothetical protein [Rhodospirillaceae bacterium]MBT6962267.1 hypothetical protein [Rhodospirillaceae bacterium]
MSRLLSGAIVASIIMVSAAQAQPQKEPKGPMGRGGGGVSPVMMTCGPDLKKFCDGQRGMPGVQCLMENITDISEPCADALDQASANMGQGHGNGDGDSEADD